MFSILLDPQLIHSFNLSLGDTLREGMRFDNQLYGLVETFDVVDQMKAIHLARELTSNGTHVLVTGGEHYRVWLNLSSQLVDCLPN